METAVETRDFASAPINQALKPDDKIKLMRDMLRIRRFEQEANRYYQKGGYMGGFLHLYIGQESVAVGTCSLMGANDHVITAYRDHGHALAVGMSMNECMAELFGKVTGCSKGKGGSMHFFAPDKNYWGGHGIVGGQTPLGLGLAYGLKYKGLTGAAMCFMGDGAVNQGVFYESLNMASLFDLPIVYIIENNQYSMGTSLERSSAFRSCLAERAAGFAIDWDTCNGEEIYEVRAKAQIALDRAHRQSRPTVLEISTYRWYGHSVADSKHKGGYRTGEEIERYKDNHDPVRLFKAKLIQEGVLTEEKYEEIDNAAREEAEASGRFADESPLPADSSITED
ncbi:MAG: pyruvate dehydrogenase (acetyl-transferring) E1 component subunit alpha, partial [Verrucomicrobiaceae bacterium]